MKFQARAVMEVQQAPARFVRKADRLTVRQERMLRFLYACPFYYSMMTVHFQIKSPLKEYKTPESSDCAWPKSSACPRISRDDLLELQYRLPMPVSEVVYYKCYGTAYPRCPRCGITIEREYMHYCDRCGQRLDWSQYDLADIVQR